MALLVAGYAGVYLTTPLALEWHLSTSLGRIFAQVWPTAILVTLTALRPAEATALFSRVRPRNVRGRQ